MSEYIEIAYAAARGRLCLFTGTGFSMAVTSPTAPNWQSLLEQLCVDCEKSDELQEALFPSDPGTAPPLSLEEAAQVIDTELAAKNISIAEKSAEIIANLKLASNNEETKAFFAKSKFRVITTNYDKIAEELAGWDRCHSIIPGRPIPRSQMDVDVYHVHGSIDAPDEMVITSEDYFKFLSRESYFSRKLSTVLHEDTVVILGYSLGDANLKAIINDYRGFSRQHRVGSNIFLIARSVVDRRIKDYYLRCYGIRVLDEVEVEDFFENLNAGLKDAPERADASIRSIQKVLHDGKSFKPSYLKKRTSFFEIASALGAIGASVEDPNVVEMLGDIIEKKTELTNETGAWEQYDHLADWLIYLASTFELSNSSIEGVFLDAVERSMSHMSKEMKLGYSWAAFKSWNYGWGKIIPENRALIRKHIEKNVPTSNALEVITQF